MTKRTFSVEKDGFCGAWYPCSQPTTKGMILMLGDSSDDLMARKGAEWVNDLNCHVMAMSADKKDYGHHNYPLERFRYAIDYMKDHGCSKVGIAGASTTGMLALIAASYYPEITLTLAFSPSDFVMEGFYQDGKDGMRERPGDNESTVSWKGEPLPYLPYAYRHPEYWKKIAEYSKKTGNMIASREMFDESERRHPLKEDEKIKVERIKGRIVFVGAEDDVLWDTCRYIRRMVQRLEERPHECTWETLLYRHGTHFVFPQGMIKKMLPLGSSLLIGMMFKDGRKYSKECLATRKDLDKRLKTEITNW